MSTTDVWRGMTCGPVLTATGFVNGKWQFSTPTESTPLNRAPKIVISKIQHGGRRHFEKSKNRHISTAVSAISTKFGTVTQFGPRDCLVRYKFEI